MKHRVVNVNRTDLGRGVYEGWLMKWNGRPTSTLSGFSSRRMAKGARTCPVLPAPFGMSQSCLYWVYIPLRAWVSFTHFIQRLTSGQPRLHHAWISRLRTCVSLRMQTTRMVTSHEANNAAQWSLSEVKPVKCRHSCTGIMFSPPTLKDFASQEADTCSPGPEIPHLLRHPKVHYHVHKIRSADPILSHMNLVHTRLVHFF
jgi:hypothetical protein